MSRTSIPYGRQEISQEDIDAVVQVLRSDWLTTGPAVDTFEEEFKKAVGAPHAVAVSNGTAALHTAMHALKISHGDEVIVPAMTFAATANAVLYCGGTPVFADSNPNTLLIDAKSVEEKITPRTKAVVAVDYAGSPCDYDKLWDLTKSRGLALIADASHSVGGSYKGKPVGQLADLTTFSFHPVKIITSGEGGMVTTPRADLAERMGAFRNHGITTDHRQREETGAWFYEMRELGYNYRLTDIQCALGTSQLKNLNKWVKKRGELANLYRRRLSDIPGCRPLEAMTDRVHAYHLFVVQIESSKVNRDVVFKSMRELGIGVNVHYIPVYLHPYYRDQLGLKPGLCPKAEAAYEKILTLPLFPAMTENDLNFVCESLSRSLLN